MLKCAEKRCSKFCTGEVNHGPILKKLGKTWEIWKMKVKVMRGGELNRSHKKINYRSCVIICPPSHMLEEA